MKTIEELEAALAAATPDNWSIEFEDGRVFITGEGRQLAKILSTHVNLAEYSAHVARANANARLIALMHNTLPALIECAEVLSKLKAWEQYMGGYASTVWREAEAALAKLEQTK